MGLLTGSSSGSKTFLRDPVAKAFNQYMKNYKKTGIKIKEAMLLSPSGDNLLHEGLNSLTSADIKVS